MPAARSFSASHLRRALDIRLVLGLGADAAECAEIPSTPRDSDRDDFRCIPENSSYAPKRTTKMAPVMCDALAAEVSYPQDANRHSTEAARIPASSNGVEVDSRLELQRLAGNACSRPARPAQRDILGTARKSAVDPHRLQAHDWLVETAAPSPPARRSTRVFTRIPVRAAGKSAIGRKFRENSQTIVVNAHGALLYVQAELEMGSDIR